MKNFESKKVYRMTMLPFWLMVTVFTFLIFIGATRGNLFRKDTIPILALMVSSLIILYFANKNNYVSVNTGREIIVSGHGNWSRTTIRMAEIKYILRLPQQAVRGFGTKMIIYIEKEGALKHIQIKEVGFDDTDLKEFLTKIKLVNLKVIFDSEYEDFLLHSDRMSDKNKFSNSATRNTSNSLQNFLREKGEAV
jgi:hypothetical protein